MAEESQMNEVTSQVDVDCVSADSESLVKESREVIREGPLTIDVKDVGAYTIMCTPADLTALAVGFTFSEGIIERREDIHVLMQCPDDPNVIRMQVAKKEGANKLQRHLLIVSSCGICGSQEMEEMLAALGTAGDTLRMSRAELVALPDRLREQQKLFERTGGTHAAGMVRDDEFKAMAEDMGRHTALDKVIGMCLLADIPTAGAAAVLSSRVSVEMVAKAARAGVELIAAVSAPSSLAIKAAQRCNITLCGFVRKGKATIYCHPERIR
jgi:FdhD protein